MKRLLTAGMAALALTGVGEAQQPPQPPVAGDIALQCNPGSKSNPGRITISNYRSPTVPKGSPVTITYFVPLYNGVTGPLGGGPPTAWDERTTTYIVKHDLIWSTAEGTGLYGACISAVAHVPLVNAPP